jgi:hypothetical protein
MRWRRSIRSASVPETRAAARVGTVEESPRRASATAAFEAGAEAGKAWASAQLTTMRDPVGAASDAPPEMSRYVNDR